MRTWRNVRAVLVFAAAVAAALGVSLYGIGPEQPQAKAPRITTWPALKEGANTFAPLGDDKLFDERTKEKIELLAREKQWRLPSQLERDWDLGSDGRPIVETRRMAEMWYTVKKGQNKWRVRSMFKGRVSRLAGLNPDIEIDELTEGQQILVWQRAGEGVSESLGHAHRGRLRNGEPLPPGENYVILYPHRTFGTYYAVSEIVRVMDSYELRYPDAHSLMIGDISFRTGRAIRPHRSHQSGRDVDISYPRKNEPRNYRRFHHVRRSQLDTEKTLWLIKSFIDGGQVEYVFMDRYFQRLLIKEAREQGAPEEWIEEVFQYPHWSGTRALVRHSRGHRNHFHLRFKCQTTDRWCR